MFKWKFPKPYAFKKNMYAPLYLSGTTLKVWDFFLQLS